MTTAKKYMKSRKRAVRRRLTSQQRLRSTPKKYLKTLCVTIKGDAMLQNHMSLQELQEFIST